LALFSQVRGLGLDGHALEGFEPPPLPTLSPSPMPSSLRTAALKEASVISDAHSDVVADGSSSDISGVSYIADTSSSGVADVSSSNMNDVGRTIDSAAEVAAEFRRLEDQEEAPDAHAMTTATTTSTTENGPILKSDSGSPSIDKPSNSPDTVNHVAIELMS